MHRTALLLPFVEWRSVTCKMSSSLLPYEFVFTPVLRMRHSVSLSSSPVFSTPFL